MAMFYPMQMLLAGFALLLAFPLASSSTTLATTSKEEIKCDYCKPVANPPPPHPEIKCPPPPSPPLPTPPPASPPPPTPPPASPPSPPPPTPPPASPPSPPLPTPPPPPCRKCPQPCFGCFPLCIICPPRCPGCPCNVCQIPNTPLTPGRRDQPGVIGGTVYSPPNEVVPYFPYSFQNPPLSESSASSIHLELKLLVSIIFLMLSSALSLFSN